MKTPSIWLAFLVAALMGPLAPQLSSAGPSFDKALGDVKGKLEEDFEDEDEDEDEDYEQPPYTAGGMYSKGTWPRALLKRNLTLIEGMLQIRGGLDIDISNRRAFESWSAVVDAKYGLLDHFELQAGTKFSLAGALIDPLTQSTATFYAGFENAIWFDVVDFRMQFELKYFQFSGQDNGTDVSVVIGFPIRYRIHEKFGVVALDRLMTIHFDEPTRFRAGSGNGAEVSSKPDLTVGVGAIIQPIDLLAIVLRVEMIVVAFNFDDNGIVLPATMAVQFSPSNKFDLGFQASFLNMNAPDGKSFHDDRSLVLFGQFRL